MPALLKLAKFSVKMTFGKVKVNAASVVVGQSGQARLLAKTRNYILSRNRYLWDTTSRYSTDQPAVYFATTFVPKVVRVDCEEDEGETNKSERVECSLCGGTGRENHRNKSMLPKGEYPVWCPQCGGSGLCYKAHNLTGNIGFRLPHFNTTSEESPDR